LILFLCGLAYSCVLAFGAVKMQSLESYTWGMAASVMSMIPVAMLGILGVLYLLVTLIDIALVSALDWDLPMDTIAWVFLALLLAGPALGFYALMNLINPEIKEGFFFNPE